MSKFSETLRTEIGLKRDWSGWTLVRFLLAILPSGAFVRTRALILKAWGLPIGRGATLAGTPTFAGNVDPRKALSIGARSFINHVVYFDCSDRITVGAGVSIGHHCVFITTSHEVGGSNFRAAETLTKPIEICSGVWLGANSTILPGVTVGEGAIVAAGAVVSKDVAPNTLVGGVPAKLIRELGEG